MAQIRVQRAIRIVGSAIAGVLVVAAILTINKWRFHPLLFYQTQCKSVLKLTNNELKGLDAEIPNIRLQLAQREFGRTLEVDEIQLGEYSRKVNPLSVGGDPDGEICFTLSSGFSPFSYLYLEKDGEVILNAFGELIVIWPSNKRDELKILNMLERLENGN